MPDPVSRRRFLILSAFTTLNIAANITTISAMGRGKELPSLAATISPSPSPLPPATKNMNGLFALLSPNDATIPNEVLNSPTIRGAALQLDWSQLQPAPTIVAWDVVENALARLKAVNKVLVLRVNAGTGSPAWLYEQKILRYSITPIGDRMHPVDFGQQVTMPRPWDKAFLKYWSAFVNTLAVRFDNDPNIVRIAVSGPCFERAEMYLPRLGTVIQEWSAVGYSLTKMQDIWQDTLDIYGNAFKQTPFTLDLNPLPDQADTSGYTVNGLVPIAVAQYGLQRYPGRFFPAQSDLADQYPYLPGIPGPTKPPALYQPYEKQLATIYAFLQTTPKNNQFGLTVMDKSMSKAEDRVKVVLNRARALHSAYLEIPVAWIVDSVNSDALSAWRPYQPPPPTNTPAPKATVTKSSKPCYELA